VTVTPAADLSGLVRKCGFLRVGEERWRGQLTLPGSSAEEEERVVQVEEMSSGWRLLDADHQVLASGADLRATVEELLALPKKTRKRATKR
jgi:hypothetical protein